MKELVAQLVQKADLDEAQAEKVAGVVRSFLEERLPEAVKGPVMNALTGANVDSAVDTVSNALGGFLGGGD